MRECLLQSKTAVGADDLSTDPFTETAPKHVPRSVMIRLEPESCDATRSKEECVFNDYSQDGAIGSDYYTLIVSVYYDRKSNVSFNMTPGQLVDVVVKPSKYIPTPVFNLDCEVLYDVSRWSLDIVPPAYTNLYDLITEVVSFLTVSPGFNVALNVDISEFQPNIVPSPQQHSMLTSYTPIRSVEKTHHEQLAAHEITDFVSRRRNKKNTGNTVLPSWKKNLLFVFFLLLSSFLYGGEAFFSPSPLPPLPRLAYTRNPRTILVIAASADGGMSGESEPPSFPPKNDIPCSFVDQVRRPFCFLLILRRFCSRIH
jgi:hypothetical protein